MQRTDESPEQRSKHSSGVKLNSSSLQEDPSVDYKYKSKAFSSVRSRLKRASNVLSPDQAYNHGCNTNAKVSARKLVSQRNVQCKSAIGNARNKNNKLFDSMHLEYDSQRNLPAADYSENNGCSTTKNKRNSVNAENRTVYLGDVGQYQRVGLN